MKKTKWWMLPVILLAVFGLLIMGCPADSKKSSDDDKKVEVDPNHNYAGEGGVTDVVMFDNFKYGNGYQSWGDDDKQIAWSRLANVDIEKGDTYNFKMKFTLSRDLEDDYLYAAFVNQPTAGSWDPMYADEWVDIKANELVKVPADIDSLKAPGTYKADTPIEVEFSVTATKRGSAATAVLVFQTRGDGKLGDGGSGVKKEVTLTFSEIYVSAGDFVEIEPGPELTKLEKPASGDVPLGPITWVNGAQQQGWKVKGFEGAETGPTAAQFVWATSLILEVTVAPAGGMQLVWQGDGMNGWHQSTIIGDTGTPVEGVTVSGTTITIDLAKTIENYDTKDEEGEPAGYVWCQNNCKVLVAYYSGPADIKDWITSAKLVIED